MNNVNLWEIAVSVVVLLIGLGVKQLAAAKWSGALEDQLLGAIASAAQRVKDKFLADLALARAADSDGGETVTPEELSKARAMALQYVLGSLSGPALEYAKTRGADFIKGLIGGALDKLLAKHEIEVKPPAVTP